MSIMCDANKLPEDIQAKAYEYIKKHKPHFRTFGIVSDDVEHAWLSGFAFCFEENAKLKAQIDKMKCRENCSNYKYQIDNRCNTKCKNLSEWEPRND